MFRISKPSRKEIDAFLAAQRDQPFSYPQAGASRDQLAPPGFTADHNRIQLGTGRATFERAIQAIRDWKMFDIPWLELCWPQAHIESGATVAVVVSHLGFWSMNPCRIVYTLDSTNNAAPTDAINNRAPIEKFGFAYGTLPAHAERGEERFSVEFNSQDQSVTYDLFASSRPNALARAAYPFTRYFQKRFALDSKSAMQRACADPQSGTPRL